MGVNPSPAPGTVRAHDEDPDTGRWYHTAAALLYIFFCFEVGTFLLLFPWLDLWESNYFGGFGPAWDELWTSPYFRGAVSGLGLVNIWISFAELFRLRRHGRHDEHHPVE